MSIMHRAANQPSKPETESANLTFSIVEGLLAGTIGRRMFHMTAVSGGGAGSTRNQPATSANNPYMEGLKTVGDSKSLGHVHGGPIPPGLYKVHTPSHHPHLGLSARLDHPRFKPMGRDGFYIHGRGPHGSDGCIVPLDVSKFNELMAALKGSKGGTLFVEETVEGWRFA